MKNRCDWVPDDEIYIKYHDEEWGVPVHDDRKLFEMIILEGAQAGLSWSTILKRRENYRKAFDNFDPEKVVDYGEEKIEKLLQNEGIIRNRLKIESAVNNAKQFLKIQDEFGSFDNYIWKFVDGSPIIKEWRSIKDIPAKTDTAEDMAKDLKKKGFKFIGPTICYAFMQSVGMVNDHTVDCFRYEEINDMID